MAPINRKKPTPPTEALVWRLVFASVAVFFGFLAAAVIFVPLWIIGTIWGLE
jgi:hypothetical protein